MRNRIFIFSILLLAIGVVYGQTWQFDFVNFDDNSYVTDNSDVRAGLTIQGIKYAFTDTHTGNWHPLTWLSLMVDAQIFGDNAGGFHLTNVFFHALATLLLFSWLCRATRSPWKSMFVALLFAIHPLHVESVAWVSERKDVLSTMFVMLTLWGYIRYTATIRLRWYFLAIGMFVLSLLSKQMYVTLPFLLLLIDLWPLNRDEKTAPTDSAEVMFPRCRSERLIIEKIPFLLLTFLFCFIAHTTQNPIGGVSGIGRLSFWYRYLNVIVVYVAYLKMMFFPHGLMVFYPHPGELSFINHGLLPALILLAITLIAVKMYKQLPSFLIGWFWYLGTLVPVIGIVQIGQQQMADRYTYFPLIGVFIIIVWGIAELVKRSPKWQKIASAAGGLICMLLMVVAFQQVRVWQNSFTLFQNVLDVSPKDSIARSLAHNRLGDAYHFKGEYDLSLKHFQLQPSSLASAYYVQGLLYEKQGNLKEALHSLEKARSLDISILDSLDPDYNRVKLKLEVEDNVTD